MREIKSVLVLLPKNFFISTSILFCEGYMSIIKHEQFDLLGISTVIPEPKKKKNILSKEEKIIRKEKKEAHRAWKLLKSLKFDNLLTERHKFLLKKHYRIEV